MTEFIINSDQLERLIEAVEHDTGREVNRMVIDGVRATEIVRCRDCKHYREHEWVIATDVSDVCMFFAGGVKVAPDGFCAWGVPRFITCKCGESIELGDRESAVCPSCGRMVRE